MTTPTITPAAQTGQWQVYTNRQQKYDILVPPDWTIDDSDPASVKFDSPGRYAGVKIFMPDYHIASATESLEWWMEEYETFWPLSFRILGWDSQSYPEGKMARVWYEAQESTQYCVVAEEQVLLVPNNGWGSVWITQYTCKRHFDAYLETVLQVVSSFNRW